MNVTLMLQGEYEPFTKEVIQSYIKLPFVERIVLSTYKTELKIPSYVDVVYNEIVEPRGIGNRNLQINTSKNGMKLIDNKFAVKMRTDQLIRPHSMEIMYKRWMKNHRERKLFVMGMYRAFPYHPRDHVFWGETEDIKSLFNIPLDNDFSTEQDYRYKTRAETYIGQYYYERFDPEVTNHINNPLEFLVDTAPRKNEALTIDFKVRHLVFEPFPKVSMAWPRKGLLEYHYHVGEYFTEYWGDD